MVRRILKVAGNTHGWAVAMPNLAFNLDDDKTFLVCAGLDRTLCIKESAVSHEKSSNQTDDKQVNLTHQQRQ